MYQYKTIWCQRCYCPAAKNSLALLFKQIKKDQTNSSYILEFLFRMIKFLVNEEFYFSWSMWFKIK